MVGDLLNLIGKNKDLIKILNQLAGTPED